MRTGTSDEVGAAPLQCIALVCPMTLFILIPVFYSFLDSPWNYIVPIIMVVILIMGCVGRYMYATRTPPRKKQVANKPTKPLQECIIVEL